MARAINPLIQANEKWSYRQTTPLLLAHAVKQHGWGFIPNQGTPLPLPSPSTQLLTLLVLPPLIANASIGAVLYTTYLTTLSTLHSPSSQHSKRVYPPPPLTATFTAGFTAGTVQSLLAAPLDALVVRFKVSEMLEGHYKSLWTYGHHKLQSIGMRGVFAGYGLSFLKESLGYGVFFASFEFVKQQAYFEYLTWYYGRRHRHTAGHAACDEKIFIRPHYALEPVFLLLAGFSASVAQQVVQHPLAKIQDVHYGRLESLDYAARVEQKTALESYAKAYRRTMEQCRLQAEKVGGWRKWVYRGFLMGTLRQVPSTSAGLIVFELVRRRYAGESEGLVIEYENSRILLS